jgi:4-hydroxy-tetrahydrodipicolinate synthase
MAKYEPGQAREWAMQQLRGVTGCVMPSFTDDLSDLNEDAIAHDIARERELGFSGFLIVGECGTTPAEFRRFVDIAVAEAGDMITIVQACGDTLQGNIEIIEHAAGAGVDLVLPSNPLGFYPNSG